MFSPIPSSIALSYILLADIRSKTAVPTLLNNVISSSFSLVGFSPSITSPSSPSISSLEILPSSNGIIKSPLSLRTPSSVSTYICLRFLEHKDQFPACPV